MDSVEKTVDNILNYCNNIKCEDCIFYFQTNLQDESICGLNKPQTWKGINRDKKDFLLLKSEQSKLNEDLQKAKSEVEYYKQIYFGGNVTYGEE